MPAPPPGGHADGAPEVAAGTGAVAASTPARRPGLRGVHNIKLHGPDAQGSFRKGQYMSHPMALWDRSCSSHIPQQHSQQQHPTATPQPFPPSTLSTAPPRMWQVEWVQSASRSPGHPGTRSRRCQHGSTWMVGKTRMAGRLQSGKINSTYWAYKFSMPLLCMLYPALPACLGLSCMSSSGSLQGLEHMLTPG